MFTKEDRILFIGDSITDSERQAEPEEIGDGYVRLVRDHFICQSPANAPVIVNKGIGGNRVTDLAERWEKDVLKEQPTVLSISIGINDVWRQLDSQGIDQILPGKFETVYRALLDQSSGIRLILMEPTIIEEDPQSKGNQMLKPYVDIVRKLAEEYGAVLVPVHGAFIGYLREGSKYRLTTDGVHMTSIGNMLMARTWLTAAGAVSK
ncbi:SGNH/GDSL hydrolase family protein [Domibacillus sp. A3M-37]|uniref:SGNH/GDSL hydrolase family protein n=1 Tax=Domibacillus sp. A3M-37 TaxID=2962037 RepID=UPI0020B8F86F|nr:SGNH/GDSL hydrolase family protein [Domibacillus sp. A3M-37]MCP3763619.1 SGNH/GDSL hydrolase family protein [Domibacillus sp. A3M-37]